MKGKKTNIIKLIYKILYYNIFLSLIVAIISIAGEGTNNFLYFNFTITSSFILAVFLAFIILYPSLFFLIYTIAYIIFKIRDKVI
ncbi:MAG: hypothetical protein KJ674_03450 [Nanoarchaeota archaeon]|nr:hypothetical protein [Nanoarchaeota archaeon]